MNNINSEVQGNPFIDILQIIWRHNINKMGNSPVGQNIFHLEEFKLVENDN